MWPSCYMRLVYRHPLSRSAVSIGTTDAVRNVANGKGGGRARARTSVSFCCSSSACGRVPAFVRLGEMLCFPLMFDRSTVKEMVYVLCQGMVLEWKYVATTSRPTSVRLVAEGASQWHLINLWQRFHSQHFRAQNQFSSTSRHVGCNSGATRRTKPVTPSCVIPVTRSIYQ